MYQSFLDELRKSVHPLAMVYPVTKDGKCLPGRVMSISEVKVVIEDTHTRNHVHSDPFGVFQGRNYTDNCPGARFVLNVAHERRSLVKNVSVVRELESRTLGADGELAVRGTAIVWVSVNPNCVSGLAPPSRPDQMQLQSLIQFVIEQNNAWIHQESFQSISGSHRFVCHFAYFIQMMSYQHTCDPTRFTNRF
jgi:hypothetical protein